MSRVAAAPAEAWRLSGRPAARAVIDNDVATQDPPYGHLKASTESAEDDGERWTCDDDPEAEDADEAATPPPRPPEAPERFATAVLQPLLSF